ncbi:hypothetical protein K4U78_11535, partial [Staphylococcus epidermidis]|nr:hypothetical protein [Staphylococcus epidermidis]
KHFNIKGTAWAYTIYELAAIPGTLLCGWVSDKLFKGKRGLTGFIFMILTTIAVFALWKNPATPEAELAQYAGKAWYENPYQLMDFILMTTIGFLIYGPVMLIGLHALELAPKKAAGTSAGAVCSLLHWSSVHTAQTLSGTLPCVARTFLSFTCPARSFLRTIKGFNKPEESPSYTGPSAR